jgi:hypothetical protein
MEENNMSKRLIQRHKNCGGFILPDMKNSFSGMNYGCCYKCGKERLNFDDIDSVEESITLYTIKNPSTEEFLLYTNDDCSYTIQFESIEQADKFAEDNGIVGYMVEPNVALYCDDVPVTNGKMIINKEKEE